MNPGRQALLSQRVRVADNRYTLLGVAAILLWSFTVALSRSIAEQLGPAAAGAGVYLTSSLLIWAGRQRQGRSVRELTRLPRLYLWGCGSLFVLYTLSLFLALGLADNREQTIAVGLLNYLWPALTIVFSLWILGNRASVSLVPATLLALSGVSLVLVQDNVPAWSTLADTLASNPPAYAFGLCAAVSWGLYSNLSRRWGSPSGEGGVLLFTLAAGICFLLLVVLQPPAAAQSMRVVAEIVFMGLSTAAAYTFWDMAMRKGDAVLVAACSYMTPLLSTLVSSVYLAVMPGLWVWAGCAMIIVGSFWSWRSVRTGGAPEQCSPRLRGSGPASSRSGR